MGDGAEIFDQCLFAHSAAGVHYYYLLFQLVQRYLNY